MPAEHKVKTFNVKKPAVFINAVGKCVSDTAFWCAASAAEAVKKAAVYIFKKAAPKAEELALSAARSAAASLGKLKARFKDSASLIGCFIRHKREVGTKQAFAMLRDEVKQSKEKQRKLAATIVNYGLPVITCAILVNIITAETNVDYAVAVEYNGQEIGLVEADVVMEEAKQAVQSKITYYDVNEDVYRSASIAVKAVSSQDEVINEEQLAKKIEEQLPELTTAVTAAEENAQAEIRAEEAAEEEPEEINGKVKAFAVTVDGEFIGAVKNTEKLTEYIDSLKEEYSDDENVVDVEFNRDIEFDTENFVDPDDIHDENYYVDIFDSIVSEPVYYEVQLGDNPWNIARDNDMSLDELKECTATYEGEVIPDITERCNVGTVIQLSQEVKYLQPEVIKEETYQVYYSLPVVEIEDDTLFKGQERIDTEAVKGILEYHVYATYKDGVKISEEEIEKPATIEQATAEVKRVGTIEPSTYVSTGSGGSGDYYWPVAGGYISAYQGDGRGHKGIDIAAPYGTPIYAAEEGQVIETGSGWNGGYGNCIRIQHPNGTITVYAHQSSLAVGYGEYVVKGQLIGYVGSTGDSTGNHLHFEVRSNGRYLNPLDYVSQY